MVCSEIETKVGRMTLFDSRVQLKGLGDISLTFLACCNPKFLLMQRPFGYLRSGMYYGSVLHPGLFECSILIVFRMQYDQGLMQFLRDVYAGDLVMIKYETFDHYCDSFVHVASWSSTLRHWRRYLLGDSCATVLNFLPTWHKRLSLHVPMRLAFDDPRVYSEESSNFWISACYFAQ